MVKETYNLIEGEFFGQKFNKKILPSTKFVSFTSVYFQQIEMIKLFESKKTLSLTQFWPLLAIIMQPTIIQVISLKVSYRQLLYMIWPLILYMARLNSVI